MKKITKERLLSQLSAAAFADFTRFVAVESDGEMQILRVTDTSRLSRSDRAAVAGIKAGTKGIEVKLCDKLKAIEMIARFTGIFGDTGEEDSLKMLFDSLTGGDDDAG